MKLTLGFSPLPNDTYIFDALVNNKIDTGGLSFEVIMEDVQTLNEMAIEKNIDITKISYGSLPLVLTDYAVLNSGGALGKGVGPLLIAPFPLPEEAVRCAVVAIPGRNTTAHVLFSLAYPDATNKVFVRYDEIEDFVLSNTGTPDNMKDVKLGVIIHENRFTYQERGLVKITDLGHFWEEETGLPVPLGGIVARRSLPANVKNKVQDLIRKSIAHAVSQNGILSDFIKNNAMEMSEEVMKMHIALYVNDYTVDLGEGGRQAVTKFVQVHSAINKLPADLENMFL